MKRRIACISEHASPLTTAGDADCHRQSPYVSELACQLLQKGYQIDIFTRVEDLEQPEVVVYKPGIRVIHIKAGPMGVVPKEALLKHMDEFSLNVSRFIREQDFRYDLVHANFFMSGLVAMELKKKFNIPFVMSFHSLGHVRKVGDGQDRFPAGRIAIEEQIVKRADAIVAGSPQDKNDLIQYYKANSAKIFIIPYGFSPSAFFPVDKQQARERLQLDTSEKIVLYAGAMQRHKGADNVLKSIALLDAGKQLIRMVVLPTDIADADPESDAELARLRKLAEDLGISRQVTFVSKQGHEQLGYYYSAADLFVTTPWHGPFGSSPLESMACGTPVIGTDEGSIKYSVVEGKTGFLVPAREPEALADRIRLVINNKALLQQMSKMAVMHVNTCFTWEIIAGHVHNLYEYILLNHLHKTPDSKPVRVKILNSTIPLRNMYLRRNIEPKYGS
jgi:glycosyltransferase involved in cell wall biosynthesis